MSLEEYKWIAKKEGREEQFEENVRVLMENLNISREQALEMLTPKTAPAKDSIGPVQTFRVTDREKK